MALCSIGNKEETTALFVAQQKELTFLLQGAGGGHERQYSRCVFKEVTLQQTVSVLHVSCLIDCHHHDWFLLWSWQFIHTLLYALPSSKSLFYIKNHVLVLCYYDF